MQDYTIGFIGAGNMGRSLIGGLISDGLPPARIRAFDTDAARVEELGSRLGIPASASMTAMAAEVDCLVLAVKPQTIKQVAEQIGAAGSEPGPLYISIAAGVRSRDLARWLGERAAIVRAMPNTPALVGSGVTALVANAAVTERQHNLAENVLRAVGSVLWLEDEDLIDAVTAVSGSGPAYYFLFMEIIERAGQDLGLPRDVARMLSVQTAFGAAKMALEADVDPATLRDQVTSPGGTTEQALRVLAERDIEKILSDAVAAACRRARELADVFGEA